MVVKEEKGVLYTEISIIHMNIIIFHSHQNQNGCICHTEQSCRKAFFVINTVVENAVGTVQH